MVLPSETSCSARSVLLAVGHATAWLLLISLTVWHHVIISDLVHSVSGFCETWQSGFHSLLGFGSLVPDTRQIQSSALIGLEDCGAYNFTQNETFCTAEAAANMTGSQSLRVHRAFPDSLESVGQVARDKYFGNSPAFSVLAQDLDSINSSLAAFGAEPGNNSCQKTALVNCRIFWAAERILSRSDEVEKDVQVLIGYDAVVAMDKHKDMLLGLHAMPYYLILFWLCVQVMRNRLRKSTAQVVAEVTGDSERSTKSTGIILSFWCQLGCCLLFASQVVFILLLCSFFILLSDGIEVAEFHGSPSLTELVSHVETEYPDFFSASFAPLLGSLSRFFWALLTMGVTGLLGCMFSISICCCSSDVQCDDIEQFAAVSVTASNFLS
eukprot:gb/GFBE01041220.1/.p1 GENE.gb/GFBE01041220.1/~~gb/GFBE01041220.1/.p1  ORF type:complete len:382 (+),score=67.50 gb/GFBE01041220.1/:1-1146(+)